jgi:flagellar protein FliO/FliZ
MRRFLFAFFASPALAAETAAPSALSAMLQSFFALLLVLGVIAGAAWLLKRTQQLHTPSNSVLKNISALAVGPKERVVVVEVGDTWLVVGVAPGHVRTLHTLPRQELPAASAVAPKFAEWLSRARKGGNAR